MSAQTTECPEGTSPVASGRVILCKDSDGNITTSVIQGNGVAAQVKKDNNELSWTDTEFWSTGYFLIYITSGLVALAGWLLNQSVTHFVILMGLYLGDSGVGAGINAGWETIRDIVNLTFVFGLIYLAFMTIARADTKKLKEGVVKILIGALLVNFSMFIAKAIIDVANVTAVTIFTNMQVPSKIVNGQESYGIAWFFMEQLGLLKLLDPAAAAQTNGIGFGFSVSELSWPFSIMVSIVFLVTSFVFIAGAVLLAIRFIVLALIIILSPIAFAAAFVPKLNTEELRSDWWGRLINHAFFAPAYFLMLWISMKVVTLPQLKQTSLLDFFSQGNALAMMNFIMVIGFLIGSLIIAKKFGAVGASTALSWGKSARLYGQRMLLRGAGNVTAGTAAVAGRRTFGRLGNKYANSEALKEAASQGGLRGMAARRALGLSRTAEKASFDARQVGGAGKALGIGEGKTGGYKQTLEDVKKRDEEYAQSLGTVKDDDPRVMALKHEAEEEEYELQKLKNEKEAATTAQEKNAIETKIRAQEKKIKAANEAVEREKNRRQIGSAVSVSDMEDLAKEDDDLRYTLKELGSSKDSLKKAKEAYMNAQSHAEREAAIGEIRNAQKNIKRLEEMKEQRLDVIARGNATGYAGVIDSYSKGMTGVVWSAAYGRNRQMNKKSSEGIRDKYKKKDKEKKESKKKVEKPSGGENKDEKHEDEGGHGDHH